MLSYCLRCTKNTQSKNPKVVKTKNGRIMFSSKYEMCDSKNQNLPKSKKLSDY